MIESLERFPVDLQELVPGLEGPLCTDDAPGKDGSDVVVRTDFLPVFDVDGALEGDSQTALLVGLAKESNL